MGRPGPAEPAVPVPTWFDRAAGAALYTLLGVGLVGVVLSWFGWYEPAAVLAVGAAAGYTLFSLREGFEAGERWSFDHSGPALVALVAAVAVAGLIAAFPSEALLPGDDAAAVLIDANLLAGEGEARLAPAAPQWQDGPVTFGAPGYRVENDGGLRSSSPPFTAAVAGSVGWIGTAAMLRVGAVMAAIGLVVFYGFAARLVRPWTAAVLTVALAANPALVHLARDGSAALPALGLVFGALTLLWDDQSRHRPRRAVLAGALAGGAAFAGYEWLILAIPLAALVAHERQVSRSRPWTERRRHGRFWLLVGAGYLPMAALALAAGSRAGDLIDRSGVQPGWLAAGVGLAIGLGLVMPVARPDAARHHRVAGIAGVAVVLVLGGYLGLLRPVTATNTGAAMRVVAEVQGAEGLSVDAARTYAEDSGLWLHWYAGPVAAGAGLAGWALLAGLAAARGAGGWRPLLFAFLTVSIIWMIRPGIAPIHIGVMARFLPLTIPALLIGGGWLAERLWAWKRQLVEVAQVAALGIVAGAVAFPVWFLTDTWDLATQRGVVGGVEELCDRIGGDAAVLVAGDGELAARLPMTLRAFCGIEAVASEGPVTASAYAALAAEWQTAGRNLLVLTPQRPVSPFLTTGSDPQRLPDLRFTSLERRVEGRPGAGVETVLTIWVTEVAG